MINPKLKPLVKIEVENMKRDGIIFSVRHSDWISNPMVVRKKNGYIRLCDEFQDLNRASLEDNYHFPNMEMLLQ